jgi:SAM-dependent methyltransferase
MEGVETFVDLGGNTGEFALRLCVRHARMAATVVDLPVVCAIGRAHVDRAAEPSVARRIAFRPSDMRRDPLPPAADLVSLKSVLHDWPEQDAVLLLERAARIVKPGGRLVIFERAPLDLRARPLTFAMAPDLVFLHFLRPAELYMRTLKACGFQDIEYRKIPLEIDFHLIVAQRTA